MPAPRRNVKLGFYVSLLDWHHPAYPLPPGKRAGLGRLPGLPARPGARAVHQLWRTRLHLVRRRLAGSRATEIPIAYFLPGGSFEYDKLYDMIHTLQPDAVIENNRHEKPLPGEDIQGFEQDLPGENTTGFNTTDLWPADRGVHDHQRPLGLEPQRQQHQVGAPARACPGARRPASAATCCSTSARRRKAKSCPCMPNGCAAWAAGWRTTAPASTARVPASFPHARNGQHPPRRHPLRACAGRRQRQRHPERCAANVTSARLVNNGQALTLEREGGNFFVSLRGRPHDDLYSARTARRLQHRPRTALGAGKKTSPGRTQRRSYP